MPEILGKIRQSQQDYRQTGDVKRLDLAIKHPYGDDREYHSENSPYDKNMKLGH